MLSWEVSLQMAGMLKAAVKYAVFINERENGFTNSCLLVLATLLVHDPFLVTCLALWPQPSEGRAPRTSCMLNGAESSGRSGG